MSEKELSIAEAVRKIIFKHPCIMDSLILGIGNYSQISKLIYDEVVEELGGRNPSLYAMKMGLKRYAENLRSWAKLNEDRIFYVLINSQLEMINDVILITFKSKFFIEKFLNLIQKIEGHFIHFTQGRRNVTVVMDRMAYNKIRKYIERKDLVEFLNDQSAIILVSPHDIISVPGVVYYITGLLYYEGINITQIISSYVDTIVIVNKKEGLKTYSVIENIIRYFRGEK